MFRLIPILFLAFVVIVVINIWQSPYHSQEDKLLWSGAVIFFPGVGILFWLLYGKNRY